VNNLATVVTVAFSAYAGIAIVFLISENRRPQATLAWTLAFFFMPGLGLLIYILFGRDWKAFSKQRQLLLQDVKANAFPLLSSLLAVELMQL
jgi:cardiolipin synthase